LPVGDRLVPMIFISDGTHLTNFSGDTKAWPIYMRIRNLSAVARMKYTTHNMLFLALLPIPVEMCDVSLNRRNVQREHNRVIAYQESMATMLRPLEELTKSGIKVLYADGRTRHAYPRIASFLADYPEQCNITGVKCGWCPQCEIDPDDIPGFNRRTRRRHPQ
ncbi:hypothetical protein K440DRAFT_554784, partial [Wilcoxina mikolae CBS 423.85]